MRKFLRDSYACTVHDVCTEHYGMRAWSSLQVSTVQLPHAAARADRQGLHGSQFNLKPCLQHMLAEPPCHLAHAHHTFIHSTHVFHANLVHTVLRMSMYEVLV